MALSIMQRSVRIRLAIIGGLIRGLAASNDQQPATRLSPPGPTKETPTLEDDLHNVPLGGRPFPKELQGCLGLRASGRIVRLGTNAKAAQRFSEGQPVAVCRPVLGENMWSFGASLSWRFRTQFPIRLRNRCS
jgi:hypothetical protein